MTFGRKLRSLRGAGGVSQRQLAELLDMDTAYLSRIENDVPNHLPSVVTIQRMAKALDLNTAEADELYILANKVPPDVQIKLITKPHLLNKVRKLK